MGYPSTVKIMDYEHKWNLLRKARWQAFLSSQKWAVHPHLLCLCCRHGSRREWGWGKPRDPSTQELLRGPTWEGTRWSRPLYPGCQPAPNTRPHQLAVSSLPLLPTARTFEQLSFVKSVIRKGKTRATIKLNKNLTLTWGLHTSIWAQGGAGWGSPSLHGSAFTPGFRSKWEKPAPLHGWGVQTLWCLMLKSGVGMDPSWEGTGWTEGFRQAVALLLRSWIPHGRWWVWSGKPWWPLLLLACLSQIHRS